MQSWIVFLFNIMVFPYVGPQNEFTC